MPAILLTTGLLVVTSPASAQPSCLDFGGLLAPGGQLELTVDDSEWIELDVRYDRVYRFTVSAIAGTAFEVWSLDFDEGEQCYVRDDLLVSRDLAEPTAVIDWTDPSVVGAGLRIALPTGAGPTTVVVELEEVAAPPEDGVLVVPAVAHTIGARGELFQSDLVLFNPLGVAVPAALVFVPTGGVAKQRVEIEAEATIGHDEVYVWGSVVDNRTGDAIFVPPIPY